MLEFDFLLEGEGAGTGEGAGNGETGTGTGDTGNTDQTQNNPLVQFLPLGIMILLFVGMYFLMIRPQKKQEKKDAEMRNALAVGDEVTTIGGIIGKVVSIKDETFVLETTKDKTKIRFLRAAIRSVDVRAADLAAQIIEANKADEVKELDNDFDMPAEEAAEEKPSKKNKK